MKSFVLFLFSILIFMLQASAVSAEESHNLMPATTKSSAFVTVKDGRFVREGKPYNFVGVNLWYGAYLGSQKKDVGDRQRLIKELDSLQSLGISNVRVLGGSELSPLRDAMRPAIRNQEGVQRPDILEGLDFLLHELGKRKMTAVIYLTNFWEWSGGMATYLNWIKKGPIVDPSDPAHPWPAFALYSAEFYRNDEAKALFNDYIRTLLNRINSISGRPYKDDPAIMSWQLANEPRPGHMDHSKLHLKVYYRWVADSAQLIKKQAPRQLVSIGSEGYMGCIQSEECVLKSHAQPGIDYMTFHLWLKNWSWFDAANAKASYQPALSKARAYIEQHQRLAKSLNMPLILEEFGLERDLGAFSKQSSLTYRDRFLSEIYGLVEQSVERGLPLQGSNVWAWGGYGEAEHDDYAWRDGDKSFTGDPPQEPQGLNSVFASDASTLKIIKHHAKNIEALNNKH